jgi:MFS family permease
MDTERYAAPAIRFDPAFIVLGLAVFAVAWFAPPLFRVATIAVAVALLVLAPMPRGTRGLTFAVMIGLATGIGSISLFAVGIFQMPVVREFGWTQAQYSLVTPLSTVVTVISSVAIGRLFDRRGVRRFALACTALVGLMLASLYWLTPSPWHLYAVFMLMQVLGAGTSSVAYSRVVARWFAARRGQAFGAALAGVGIGAAVLSAVSQLLIGSFGWRGAYVGLGLLLLCVTLPVLFVWLHDAPEDVGLGLDGEPPARAEAGRAPIELAPTPLLGFTASQTRRIRRFWAMLAAFIVLAFSIGGVMLQLVPILRARGIAPEQAATIQAGLGLALIVGRAFAGYLMDRLFAPYVAATIIVFPMAGAALLASGAVGGQALVAAVFLGLAAGAELDVVAYLCTRYFGTRGYSENYGWFYAAWTLGSGTAPLLTAYSYDRLGTHTPILWVYVGLFGLAALLIARLGPYPRLMAAEPA